MVDDKILFDHFVQYNSRLFNRLERPFYAKNRSLRNEILAKSSK